MPLGLATCKGPLLLQVAAYDVASISRLLQFLFLKSLDLEFVHDVPCLLLWYYVAIKETSEQFPSYIAAAAASFQ